MRRLALVFIVLLCGVGCGSPPAQAVQEPDRAAAPYEEPVAASDTLRVLFIGNSYTYVNHLPRLLQRLAASAARPMTVAMVAPGGATLERHWNEDPARRMIAQGGWTHVVLQEQSLRPLRDREKLFTYARLFNTAIKQAGATTVLYLSWARANRPETQAALTDAFMTLADELDAEVAPVGIAWQQARREKPDVALYFEDGSHPSPTGTYLAACVFFAAVVGQSPEGLSRIRQSTRFATPQEGDPVDVEPLSKGEAALLQRIAGDTVRQVSNTAVE